jgi:hypothetical protein
MSTILETVRAEDYVQYFIYPSAEYSDTEDKLTELLKKISLFVSQRSEHYFWHKDSFKLNKVVQPGTVSRIEEVDHSLQNAHDPCMKKINSYNFLEHDRSHLHGVVYFGENIDDEWFVVYLIQQISDNFDVVVR